MSEVEDTGIRRCLTLPDDCTVMIVDDDPLVRERLATLLALGGYHVLRCESASAALEQLAAYPCNIVVTDWEMPGMTGLELCRALRLRDSNRYTYILMLSVRSGPGDVLAGLGAGADDYLSKSAHAEELLARLEVGRRITRLERALRAANDENQRLSRTDPLTGAWNRRYLMEHLPRELERARRYGRPLALMICDIDEFKRVNDVFGHEAGDDVLNAFTARANTCLREGIDWLARSGGEEFVVVLPETSLCGGGKVAERLRHCLGSEPIVTRCGSLTVTVSIGVASLASVEALAQGSVMDLLRAADTCLYASKQDGRDRVTCTPHERPTRMEDVPVRSGAKSEIN